MRAWATYLLLVGCGNSAPEPRITQAPAASLAQVAAAQDAAVAACVPLASDSLLPQQVIVRDVVWRSPTELIVAIGDNMSRDPARGEPERFGLAFYDISAAPDTKPVTYRIGANDIALYGNTLLVVSSDRVSTIDLETRCVRHSEPLEIEHAAVDAARGRFFVLTKSDFLRIDGPSFKVAVDVPRPRGHLRALGYDPVSDRVIVRAWAKSADLFDGATLAPAGTLALANEPQAGPWVRPGAAEAWFVYHVDCRRRKNQGRSMPAARMSVGACLDDPKTFGSFLVRYELPSGTLRETIQYLGEPEIYGEGGASFSGDGQQLIVTSVSRAHLQKIDGPATPLRQLSTKGKPRYTWSTGDIFPAPGALDMEGARFAGSGFSYHLTVYETKTGKQLWGAPLPGKNPY